MPRRVRVATGRYPYHVLNRGMGKTRLFAKERKFEAFEEIIGQAKEQLAMRVLAWCVMSTHWHFVLWPREDGWNRPAVPGPLQVVPDPER